jgi:hypothetical protein
MQPTYEELEDECFQQSQRALKAESVIRAIREDIRKKVEWRIDNILDILDYLKDIGGDQVMSNEFKKAVLIELTEMRTVLYDKGKWE